MERLTKTIEEKGKMFACLPDCKNGCIYGWNEEEAGCRCDKFTEILCRLDKIEDILGEDYDLDRLREMVEADRDGRCVVLPKAKPKDKETLFDALSEAVSSWGDMSKGEKALADSILAAMKGDCHE